MPVAVLGRSNIPRIPHNSKNTNANPTNSTEIVWRLSTPWTAPASGPSRAVSASPAPAASGGVPACRDGLGGTSSGVVGGSASGAGS